MSFCLGAAFVPSALAAVGGVALGAVDGQPSARACRTAVRKGGADGLGFGTELRERFRCGSAVVELDANMRPIRVLYGPLPGGLQSVGRAERSVAPQAIVHCDVPIEVVSDLLRLAQEARGLRGSLSGAGATRGTSSVRSAAASSRRATQAHPGQGGGTRFNDLGVTVPAVAGASMCATERLALLCATRARDLGWLACARQACPGVTAGSAGL